MKEETGFWRSLLKTLAANPISTFAVFCVAATGIFLGLMTERLLGVIESPGWCSKAIQAERISPGSTYVGLTTCVELLKIQLEGAVKGFLISLGSYSFVLLVLIIVVVAGAKANFKIGKDGIEGNVSRDAVEGAEHVKDAADLAAAEVKAGQ